jgi:hypothetical protein
MLPLTESEAAHLEEKVSGHWSANCQASISASMAIILVK